VRWWNDKHDDASNVEYFKIDAIVKVEDDRYATVCGGVEDGKDGATIS